MKKRNIAIVAGGYSSEHDVSLKSAAGLMSFLDKERYNVSIVNLEKGDFSALEQLRNYDFAYITIHGTPGENGLLQGYLEMIGVPYSCCGVLQAALTFNKYACNHYLENFGIPISPSILLRQGMKRPTDQEIADELGLPCFIKSNVGGSSFGVTKVKTVEEVTPAIELAFKEGNEVICERYMKGVEVTCGVYKTRNKAVAFPLTEIVSENEFFDYEAKYLNKSQEITPARIPDEVRDRIQEMTLRIYDILGCNGFIRIDYILTEGWAINLLEINTTPGMTQASLIPQQVKAAGLDIKDVLTDIIENQFAQ